MPELSTFSLQLCTYNMKQRVDKESNEAYNQRKRDVLDKIKGQFGNGSLLCLQEVTKDYYSDLKLLLAEYRYHMVSSTPKYYNRDRGEAIAYPERLAVVEENVNKLSDAMPWEVSSKACQSDDRYACAKGRNIHVAFARFRDRETGAVFCVGSCHLLSRANTKTTATLQSLQSWYVVHEFQQFCGRHEGVLAGDFNVSHDDPDVPVYKMITTAKYGRKLKENLNYLPVPPGFPGKLLETKLRKMRSAYVTKLDHEPNFTGASSREKPYNSDYIFLSTGWTVSDVIRIPEPTPKLLKLMGKAGPEPSDHLMLGATIALYVPSKVITRPERVPPRKTSSATEQRVGQKGEKRMSRWRCVCKYRCSHRCYYQRVKVIRICCWVEDGKVKYFRGYLKWAVTTSGAHMSAKVSG